MRASSSGSREEAKRRMPALSPSASAKAAPRTMPVSSMVWWVSTSRSPRALSSRSNPPWRPICSSMWSKNGMPVETLALPVPSRSIRTEISVSLVDRFFTATLGGFTWPAPSSEDLLEGGQEGVVLLRPADRDPQAVVEAGPAGEVADEDAGVEQPFPGDLPGGASPGASGVSPDTKEDEVGPRREDIDAVQGGQGGADPVAFGLD